MARKSSKNYYIAKLYYLTQPSDIYHLYKNLI